MTAARARYEQAIRLAPDLREAHEGLSYVLSRTGDESAAEEHRARAFTGRPLRTREFRGEGSPTAVLLLVSGKGGNVYTDALLDDRTFLVHELVVDYDRGEQAVPPHAILFNAIGDADRCAQALERAAMRVRNFSGRIINDPQAVLRTSRIENSRRLGRLERVRTARVRTLEPGGDPPFAFPFLVRTPGHHTGRHFVLVNDAAEMRDALERLPGRQQLAIEYLDTRSPDGYFRKYRVMTIDGKLYPVHLAISREWKVHFMTSMTAGNPAFEAQERQFLNDPRAALGEPAVRALERVASAVGLDYGGIDFAAGPGGELTIFEANATMILVPPEQDRFAGQHRAATERALAAARAMLLR